MAMVDVVTCCLQAGLLLKSVGLVQRSATTWRCSAFIARTGKTCNDSESWWSTINIVLILLLLLLLLLLLHNVTQPMNTKVIKPTYAALSCNVHMV